MASTDARIDAYIADAAPFAQPVLRQIRAWVHAGCPEVEEAIKWGMPSFVYRGKLMCGMAAFKQHASLGFRGHGDAAGNEGMGQYGKLTGLEQLPDAASFQAAMQAAMARIDAGGKRPAGKPRAALPMPDDLHQALAADTRAQAGFQALAASYQREYIQWISEAKREATRRQRIAQALQWLAEGKKRNWKYDNC
ncbi:MAG: YdeI family protein [Stenotrophomonas sp.]